MTTWSKQLDIYGVWLHITTDRKGWTRLCKRIDSLDKEPIGLGYTSRDVEDDGNIHISMYIDAAKHVGNPQGLVEILAHEAAHAAGMLLDFLGQEYDGQSEAFAYLVGFIAATAWDVCGASSS